MERSVTVKSDVVAAATEWLKIANLTTIRQLGPFCRRESIFANTFLLYSGNLISLRDSLGIEIRGRNS